MRTGLIIYLTLFIIVIGTIITTKILFSRFPKSKLTDFWKRHIVTDEDLESL